MLEIAQRFILIYFFENNVEEMSLKIRDNRKIIAISEDNQWLPKYQ
jgi:hypothetical protein